MTAVSPYGSAVGDPSIVGSATGLLAVFNEAGVLDPLDVLAASAIARILDETDELAILAAAMTVRGTRLGHVCIRLDALREAVVVDGQDADVVDALPWPDPAVWKASVSGSVLIGDGTRDHPLVLSGDLLYLERYFRYEEQVGGLISDRCDAEFGNVSAQTVTMLESLLGSDAEDPTRQHAAAVLALTGNISVIVGGPGTGKTHTIGALLVALAADDSGEFPLVALCAPTGKAAARLGEALAELATEIDDEAIRETLAEIIPSTIHRLLGWGRGRGRFAHHAKNRLAHDLVIVDEMSMVSLPLAAKLLAAVRDDATVVLVGDPFQLESIEAGTVLADIAGAGRASGSSRGAKKPAIDDHVVVLDRVHRFESDSAIASFAESMRGGQDDQAMELLSGGDDQLRWIEGRLDPAFGELWDALVSQRTRIVELAGEPGNDQAALDAVSEMAVLCAHRNGPDSVWGWGHDIETALDDRFTGLRWDGEWYPGRPVMITRNDYTHELYNGDIGVAVETDDGLRAVFERGDIRAFPLSQLGEYSTVHAMTIHKAQGSQFDEVVVVLPGATSRLLTRELLYTAVTRARSRVWVVGGEEAVRQGVSRSVQRASGLGERLWG